MASNELIPENKPTRLTGLLTRHDFHHLGTKGISSYPDRKFAILVLDISNFKSVNVFCSREKGNELLVYIADFFRSYWDGLTLVSHFRADTFATRAAVIVFFTLIPSFRPLSYALPKNFRTIYVVNAPSTAHPKQTAASFRHIMILSDAPLFP